MTVEEFFNRTNIIDLSFFNFRNAISACYFADPDLRIHRVNENFRRFFPILGDVANLYFPDVLKQIGVDDEAISSFAAQIKDQGRVYIPHVPVMIEGKQRAFSLMSTRTHDEHFTYLNGVQGQFVDRTAEWELRREREALMEQHRDLYRAVMEGRAEDARTLSGRHLEYVEQVLADVQSEARRVERAQRRRTPA